MRDVHICEVGPRDGLQLVRQVMPTATKREWLAAALPEEPIRSHVREAGLPKVYGAAA